MSIHITDVATTTLDIKEQQRINTCGVKNTYAQYVKRKLYTKLDRSLPLRPFMDNAAIGHGIRHAGFSLSKLDKHSIERVKHNMFLPCLDTLVVSEPIYEDLHVGTDLHVFSLY